MNKRRLTCLFQGHKWSPYYMRMYFLEFGPWGRMCYRCGQWRLAGKADLLCRIGIHQWIPINKDLVPKYTETNMECAKCGVVMNQLDDY